MLHTPGPTDRGWLVTDLKRQPWRVPLPAEVSAELLSASELEPQRGHEPITGPPNTLRFVRMLMDRLSRGPGFVVVTGIPVEDDDRAQRLLSALGGFIGHPVSQNIDGALVGRVEDGGADFGNPHHRGH